MRFKHFLLMLGFCFTHAGSYVIHKLLLGSGSLLKPVDLVLLENGILALIFCIMMIPMKSFRCPPVPLKYILAIAFFGGALAPICINSAISLKLSLSIASIVGKLNVPISIILGAIICKERVSRSVALGVIIAFCGIAVLYFHKGSIGDVHAVSLLLVLMFAFFSALAVVLNRKYRSGATFSFMGWMVIVTFIQTLIFGQVFHMEHAHALSHYVVILVLCLAVIKCFGASVWYYLIDKYPVSQVSPFLLLGPMFSTLASVVIFRESFGHYKIISFMLIITGLFIVVMRQRNVGVSVNNTKSVV